MSAVEQADRDAIMRQGVVRPETPRDRRELAALDEDLRSLPGVGRPLRLRPGGVRPRADTYLAGSRGPLAYMVRLLEIERRTEQLEEACADAWRSLAEELRNDPQRFSERWRDEARRFPFGEVNDLVERHNRWFPVESNLAMDPRTGDYVLVNGRRYTLASLDARWVLDRFPASLERAVENA